jgi:hypothetical protein
MPHFTIVCGFDADISDTLTMRVEKVVDHATRYHKPSLFELTRLAR